MTGNSAVELELCPFCGGEPELHFDGGSCSWVSCPNDECFVQPTTGSFTRREDAAAKWNTRTLAAWQPIETAPKHGKRIYALTDEGKAMVVYANPELDRSIYVAWWPLPEHGRAALQSGRSK